MIKYILLFFGMLCSVGGICKGEADTVKVILLNTDTGSRAIRLDSTSVRLLLKNDDSPSFWKNWEFWIQFLIVGLTVVAARQAWQTFRRDKTYQDQTYLTEYNKIMIEHPELRAFKNEYISDRIFSIVIAAPAKITIQKKEKVQVLDDHEFNVVSGGSTTKKTGAATALYELKEGDVVHFIKGGAFCMRSTEDEMLQTRLQSHCHYTINYFELVFKKGASKRNMEAWENYFNSICNDSDMFKELVVEIVTKKWKIYSPDFVKRIARLQGLSCPEELK